MGYAYCDNKLLKYDEACLTVNNFQTNIIKLSNVSLECYECLPQLFQHIVPTSSKSIIYSTRHPTVFSLIGKNINFNTIFTFEQHGHYGLNVSKNVDYYVITPPPENVYKPLWSAGILLLVIFLLYAIGACKSCYSRLYSMIVRPSVIIRDAENDLGVSRMFDSTPLISTSSIPESSNRRNASVDTFRGITIVLMLFVNYGGGKYWIFQHAEWNGMTIADLIFPWFAWIMGVSIVLSISSQLRRTVPRSAIFSKVLLRSLLLIVIGLALNSFNNNNVNKLRFPGVLQRLGLSYFIVASLETMFLQAQNYNLTSRLSHINDIINGWVQWVFIMTLVGIHSYITFNVEVPNCPKGYLGPGGLHDNKIAMNCTGGVAGYIDRMLFGTQHLYQHPTLAKVYFTHQPFDPEGLLGTLNMAFTVFLGTIAGKILLYFGNQITGPPVRWMALSALCGSFALILSNASKEGGVIPINKNLWSLSFVFATSCLAFFTLCILYMIVDYFKNWNGSPFIQAGKNSILLYIGSEVTKRSIPWNWTPISMLDHSAILYMNIWSTALWILIAIFLNNNNIYLTI